MFINSHRCKILPRYINTSDRMSFCQTFWDGRENAWGPCHYDNLFHASPMMTPARSYDSLISHILVNIISSVSVSASSSSVPLMMSESISFMINESSSLI